MTQANENMYFIWLMNRKEFDLAREVLISEFANQNGTVSLRAARIARDFFRYAEGAEYTAEMFGEVRNNSRIPETMARIAELEVKSEEAARIAAGVLDPADSR